MGSFAGVRGNVHSFRDYNDDKLARRSPRRYSVSVVTEWEEERTGKEWVGLLSAKARRGRSAGVYAKQNLLSHPLSRQPTKFSAQRPATSTNHQLTTTLFWNESSGSPLSTTAQVTIYSLITT
jgi:hypothetical protein